MRPELFDMQVSLSELQFFDQGRSCTLWLDPGGSELTQLQEKLVQAFPDCTDLSHDPSRNIAKFSAHMSLGQWQSADAVQRAQKVWTSFCLPRTHSCGSSGFANGASLWSHLHADGH